MVASIVASRSRTRDRALASLAPSPGRLAQLGERRLDKAEVTGSSPVSPTYGILVYAGVSSLRGVLVVTMSSRFPGVSVVGR
jgi:hypothetical protein